MTPQDSGARSSNDKVLPSFPSRPKATSPSVDSGLWDHCECPSTGRGLLPPSRPIVAPREYRLDAVSNCWPPSRMPPGAGLIPIPGFLFSTKRYGVARRGKRRCRVLPTCIAANDPTMLTKKRRLICRPNQPKCHFRSIGALMRLLRLVSMVACRRWLPKRAQRR